MNKIFEEHLDDVFEDEMVKVEQAYGIILKINFPVYLINFQNYS
jgi:hypothetical protein